jgi:putative molybdopterin biosynthesis protein
MQRRRRTVPRPRSAPTPTVQPPLLTTVEVASLLRVHPKHVYRLFARGLPRHHVGGAWRYDRDDVLRWSSGASASATPTSAAISSALLACNGDAAVEILLHRLRSTAGALVGSVVADRDTGVELLRSGRVLAAGFHGASPTLFASRAGEPRLARLHLVRREVGLVARRGRTPRLMDIGDLAPTRFASRPPSAGVRRTIDRALAAAGLDSDAIHARARVCATHMEAVNAVAAGEADIGVATHAWARRLRLSFHALEAEDYGILLRAEDLGRPEVVQLCATAQEATFRTLLAAEAGYDSSDAGALRIEQAAPAAAVP